MELTRYPKDAKPLHSPNLDNSIAKLAYLIGTAQGIQSNIYQQKTMIIQPEIIPDGKRVRLLKNGDKKSVYKPVGTLATELKRKPQTLREWAKLLLIHSPDFFQHFKPRTAYNPYVQEWLTRINNYDITEPASAPRPQIIEDFIQLNAPIFTFENYLQELTNEYTTEQKIDNAKLSKVA